MIAVGSTWTPERIVWLRELWPSGLTTRQISVEIFGNEKYRNAIIGKARRLGLALHDSPIVKREFDKEKFTRLWNNEFMTMSRICEIFRSDAKTIRKHAGRLGLKGRERLARKVSKTFDSVSGHYIRSWGDKGWFKTTAMCCCAGCLFLAVPGSEVCYGDAYAVNP